LPKMQNRRVLDGNGAAAEALRLARVQVVAAYPVTPQSPIAEKLAGYVTEGSLKAKYIRVESEHSAMSCAIGAQLTGARAGTATSSVGLALMHEVLGVASGCRVPIVMAVVNRALVSPWSLWCDHQDAMAERDSGWLQFYAENVQEVLDLLLMAFRIAEHEEVLTPAMVCLDGFFVSHSPQSVTVPAQETVDRFLPAYRPANLYLDPADPMFINGLVPPEDFTEMRYQQQVGFEQALEVIPLVQDEFLRSFGRTYSMVESYRTEDADVILVTLGSMAGTAKHVVNKLRKRGQRVGVLKLSVFRPFAAEQLRKALGPGQVVGVLDRSAGLGAQAGPLCLEVESALAGADVPVYGYVGGLGGRDITETTVGAIFRELQELREGRRSEPARRWIDARPEAMTIRPFGEQES
jgi:pyruvate ferredoxin oxidoreductase alpha subunit